MSLSLSYINIITKIFIKINFSFFLQDILVFVAGALPAELPYHTVRVGLEPTTTCLSSLKLNCCQCLSLSYRYIISYFFIKINFSLLSQLFNREAAAPRLKKHSFPKKFRTTRMAQLHQRLILDLTDSFFS